MEVPVFNPNRDPQVGSSLADALDWLSQVTYALGGGFHPDTPGNQYVENDSGKRSMTDEQAEQFDADLAEVFDILEDHQKDIYNEGLYFQWRLTNGLPRVSADEVNDRARYEEAEPPTKLKAADKPKQPTILAVIQGGIVIGVAVQGFGFVDFEVLDWDFMDDHRPQKVELSDWARSMLDAASLASIDKHNADVKD